MDDDLDLYHSDYQFIDRNQIDKSNESIRFKKKQKEEMNDFIVSDSGDDKDYN